jgi:transposase-like protein
MPAPRKYPQELRDRAIRLVNEAMAEDPELSLNAAVIRIGPRVGVVPDTLRGWMKRARIDSGMALGTTTSDAKRIKDLEREVKELKRSNEILLAASSFFARELDPRLPW